MIWKQIKTTVAFTITMKKPLEINLTKELKISIVKNLNTDEKNWRENTHWNIAHFMDWKNKYC
jgi:hypothetical protein